MASIEKRKTRSGAWRWLVRYYVHMNGERQQKARRFQTSKAAKDFAATTESAILTGRYADARGLTVGEYLGMWLKTYTANIRPNSLNGYQINVNVHIKPRIGGERLESLNTTIIQSAYNDILSTEYKPAVYERRGKLQAMITPAKTYTPKTVRNVHAVLRMALDQARRDGLIFRNPAEDVKMPPAKPLEYTIPEPEQLQRLLSELRHSEYYLAILTCALLACRRGEALGLYWSDIDFDAGTVELKRALITNNLTHTVEIGELKTKNARRTLPLPDALRVSLLAERERRAQAANAAGTHVMDTPFVFADVTGKPFRPDSITQAFKRAAQRADLPNMRLHDLRHTGITYMIANGADPKTVSSFVGHATAQFTMNQYTHVMEQNKRKAGALLESKVLLPTDSP